MKVREATRLFVKVLEARARDALEALKVSGKLQLNLETFDAIGVRCAKAEVRLRAARSEYASAQELVIHLKDQRDDAFAPFTEPDTREARSEAFDGPEEPEPAVFGGGAGASVLCEYCKEECWGGQKKCSGCGAPPPRKRRVKR